MEKDELNKQVAHAMEMPQSDRRPRGRILFCVNNTNLEETNSDEWELEQEEKSTSEGLMTEELCGHVCSILYQIR
jgi:hypothetical protein